MTSEETRLLAIHVRQGNHEAMSNGEPGARASPALRAQWDHESAEQHDSAVANDAHSLRMRRSIEPSHQRANTANK